MNLEKTVLSWYGNEWMESAESGENVENQGK